MKKLFILLFGLLSLVAKAQILTPVKWSATIQQREGESTAVLVLKAKIDKSFHVYSQFIDGDGPVPTSFSFTKSDNYELIGKVEEGKAVNEFDVNFGIQLKYFENVATFKQKIKIKSAKDFVIKAAVNFMTCNDKMCLPPEDAEFEIKVKGNSNLSKADTNPVINTKPDSISDNIKPAAQAGDTVARVSQAQLKPDEKKESGIWKIFIEGFIGGLAAILMPCIFPMLPLTVSYFTKKSQTRSKAVLTAMGYGLSIILIYVTLGLGVTALFGSSALNELASNGIFNFVFFLMLVAFAASFFGAFEITLPNWMVNKSDEQSEKGGIIGIFFMAVTLAVVSFSCTGPIIGTLLVDAASKGAVLGPAMGMFGFSFALALPFTLFAAFPSLLSSLPKSGGWLNSVKVVLGFLELALALKFLSNVDLAYHWHFFDREVFLALWIIIFALLGYYLLGRLKFSHDSDFMHLSTTRLF